ncbi:hypothetical protein EC991_009166 [Linnemannia zychae]|nr:hypothetical protein EC991_009166 [Linnemannia zychae]
MTTGGFFTRKLHIPRQVWYQRTNGATSMVRLPAADAKINACHTIAIMLEHMVGVLIKHGILEPIMTSSPEARESGLRDSGEGSSGGEGEGEGEVLESSPYSSSSNSSSSSFASPYSPFTPSLASFLTSSTTSNTSASSAITTSQPSTPATPTQSLFTNLAGFTSIAAAAATNKSKSNRNSANESEQAAAPPPTHSAIITFNTEDPSRATTTTALLIKELEALESATLQIWAKLSKKLSFVHRPGKYFGANSGHDLSGGAGNGNGGGPKFRDHDYHDDSHNYHHHGHHQHGYGASTTSATTVGTDLKSQWKMFSKSVQKSMANDKVEDTAPYTDSVLRLFQSANILEQLFHHYSTLSATASTTTPAATPTVATFSAATSTSLPQTHYTQIITCLRRIGDFLNLVICAFVVRDLGTFLAKYNKRVGSWIVE